MGPHLAATRFAARHPEAESFRVTLYGSLAATGRGHLTDRAIMDVLEPVGSLDQARHRADVAVGAANASTVDGEIFHGDIIERAEETAFRFLSDHHIQISDAMAATVKRGVVIRHHLAVADGRELHAGQGNVDAWLDEFETFSIYEIFPEILALWNMNNQTTSKPKKN